MPDGGFALDQRREDRLGRCLKLMHPARIAVLANALRLGREGNALASELGARRLALVLDFRQVRDLLVCVLDVLGDPLGPDMLSRERGITAEDAAASGTL